MVTDEMVEAFGNAFWSVNAASKMDGQREHIRSALEAALSTDVRAKSVNPVVPLLKTRFKLSFDSKGRCTTFRKDQVEELSGKWFWLIEATNGMNDPLYANALSAQVQDESEIIECLLSGKPFVFDPATNFCHADDGAAPAHGIKYVPAAQVQDVADTEVYYTTVNNWENKYIGQGTSSEEMGVVWDFARQKWANADFKITITASPASKHGDEE